MATVYKTCEELATELGQSRSELKARLLSARSCLKDCYRQHFTRWRYDFATKRLYGANGYYLQWQLRESPELPDSYYNQQTSSGIVFLYRAGSELT
jgi:hypothetical protein